MTHGPLALAGYAIYDDEWASLFIIIAAAFY